MTARRIYIARQLRGLSMDELVERMGGALSKMAISKYERGLMTPSAESLRKIAEAVSLPLDFFNRAPLQFNHNSFRHDKELMPEEHNQISAAIMEHVERYYAAEELAAQQVPFRNPLPRRKVHHYEEMEAMARRLRKLWELGTQPIVSVYEMLERRGVHVVEVSIENEHVDGVSFYVNGSVPFVIINTFKNRTVERKRFTALHELAHLLLNLAPLSKEEFNIPPEKPLEEGKEKLANFFASAMLFPEECVAFRLGIQRDSLDLAELISIRNLYGISIAAIVHRAHDLNIITRTCYDDMYNNHINKNRMETGWGQYPVPETADRCERLAKRISFEINLIRDLRGLYKKIRRVAPPKNSQRNNPYCDLLGIVSECKSMEK